MDASQFIARSVTFIGTIKMADENKKPWYKDTRYLSLIIAIVAIVVPIIIWLLSRRPDFSISIDPMLGAIQVGGVIQTTVSVKGSGGYDHTVSLSATGQPSGVVTAFVPPFGEAKPSYTSSVTINVDKNVPVGDYTLVFKGTGADGKEHSCSYTLTVKPPVTITPTSTPEHPVIVEITNPKEGAEASAPLTVEGKLEGELPEDWYLWTFYYNYEEWYPQNRIVPFEGEWKSNVWLGSQTDVEKDVAVVLADKDADSEFQQGEPLRILPQGAQVCDQITVIVREI